MTNNLQASGLSIRSFYGFDAIRETLVIAWLSALSP
jgi:hypothetical protein